MDGKVFLVADDDSDDTDMFQEALTGIDSSVVCHFATDGAEALQKLSELDKNPHIIFLDVNMPIINGWECLKFIKEHQQYKDVPVVVVSTSSHLREMSIAADLGALCYFIKPTDFRELTQILEVIVKNMGAGLRAALQQLQADGSRSIHVLTVAK